MDVGKLGEAKLDEITNNAYEALTSVNFLWDRLFPLKYVYSLIYVNYLITWLERSLLENHESAFETPVHKVTKMACITESWKQQSLNFELLILIFQSGDFKLTFHIYRLSFLNFLLGKQPNGPGQYIFGTVTPQTPTCMFPIDYSAMNSTEEDLEPYRPDKLEKSSRRSVLVWYLITLHNIYFKQCV